MVQKDKRYCFIDASRCYWTAAENPVPLEYCRLCQKIRNIELITEKIVDKLVEKAAEKSDSL